MLQGDMRRRQIALTCLQMWVVKGCVNLGMVCMPDHSVIAIPHFGGVLHAWARMGPMATHALN